MENFLCGSVAYMKDGQTIPEDEVNAALNEAVLVIVTTIVIIQGVLVADDCAVMEGRIVGCHAKRNCLHSDRSRWRCRCCILPSTLHIVYQLPHVLCKIDRFRILLDK